MRNINILTTSGLAENKYKKYPLRYVNNRTQRLVYGLSINVSQYALSEMAYNYFNQIQVNISLNGELYEKQPLSIEGNLANLTNPDQVVLGCFYVAGIQSKRIFINKIEDIEFNYNAFCAEGDLTKVGYPPIAANVYPIYIWFMDDTTWPPHWIYSCCYDCTEQGGTLSKPNFWPH